MALIKGKQIKSNTVDLDRLSLITAGQALIANASGQVAAQAITGDATISSAGALTIGGNAINAGKIAANAVTFAKLSVDAVSSDLVSSATATELARADAVKAYTDARYTAATQYADSVAQGLDVKGSTKAASTASFTMASAASSSTLVLADGEGGFDATNNTFTIDTISLAEGNRVLIKDGVNSNGTGIHNKWNGIYTVGALTGATLTLTRADDSDQDDLTGGAFVFVEEGSANADNGFVCTTDGTPTLGTTAVTFAQFSGAGSVSAGAGITKTGNQLDVQVDGVTIEISSDTLQVKTIGTSQIAASSVTGAKLAASVAGEGLAGGNGSALSVDLNELTAAAIDLSADSIVFIDATDNATRKESAADFATALAGSGVSASGGQLTAARLSSDNQFETASATSSDGDATGISIDNVPEGMVQVFLNGSLQELKGDKTGDCFFSANGGTTAVTLSNIAATNTLHWNGSIAGYQLDTTDKLTLVYETA
jgi:hypothetical protein